MRHIESNILSSPLLFVVVVVIFFYPTFSLCILRPSSGVSYDVGYCPELIGYPCVHVCVRERERVKERERERERESIGS